MIDHLLDRNATVWRHTDVADAGGGTQRSWTARHDVHVRVSSPTPRERQTASQEGVEVDHIVYAASDADLVRGDRLVLDGLHLEVVSTVVPSEPSYLRAECRQEPFDEPTT